MNRTENTQVLQLLKYRKGSLYATLVFLSPFLVMATSATLATFAWWFHPVLGVIVGVLVIGINGTRFRALNNMSHECLHRSFTRRLGLNECFGHLCAIAEFSKFHQIRHEHASHHKFLGDFSRDQDFGHLADYHFEKTITRYILINHLLRALTLRMLNKYLFCIVYDHADPPWAKIGRACYLVLLLALFVAFPEQVLLFFVLPFLSTYQMHKYLIDFLDHGGLLDPSRGEIDKTRNFILSCALVNWILFPRNDGYHLIHHLYPSLAVESFEDAHVLLLQDPCYATKTHEAMPQIRQWLKGSAHP